jgi:uncharacterized membrane protein YbhN (UPF0104 family)
LTAAAALAVITTVCCAWRWRIVARGLGLRLSMGEAVAACYRSQFLNTVLPSGILGDVDRAVRHGRGSGDVGRGLRAVAWERSAGQAVQIALAVVVLLALGSPVRSSMPFVVAATVAAVAVVVVALVVGRRLPHSGPSRWARAVRTAAMDVRHGLLARRAFPGILLASTVVVAGHAATFLIAARTAGSTASVVRLLPLALIVLLAAGVPTNIGGWGPREGVAAGLFGLQGVATAVVYGVMVLVASLPGALVLVTASVRGMVRHPIPAGAAEQADSWDGAEREEAAGSRIPVAAGMGGAARG